jgi:iron(III) transport system ATP-binding protein
LAPEPALVVLDEPFSALDTGLRAQVRAEVVAALRASGTTAVLVTHDQHEALSTADEVAVLLGGHIAQVADPHAVYTTPASIEVATFVGDTVVLAGYRRGARVESVLGTLVADGDRAGPDSRLRTTTVTGPTAVVRPEQLDVGPPSGAGAGGFGADGTVTGSAFFGHDALVTVVLADGTEVRARLQAGAVPRTGAPVRVTVRSAVLTFPVADTPATDVLTQAQ